MPQTGDSTLDYIIVIFFFTTKIQDCFEILMLLGTVELLFLHLFVMIWMSIVFDSKSESENNIANIPCRLKQVGLAYYY